MIAHRIWKSLESLFCDNKDARAMQLDHKIRFLEISDMSITDYFKNLKVLSDLLINIDDLLPEKTLLMYMINGIVEKCNQVASIIHHQSPLSFFFKSAPSCS